MSNPDEFKELGNAEFEKKNFKEALDHYRKAVELDPTDIIIHNNIATVYFEQNEYEECIKECDLIVEKGRESSANYKLIAEAFARAGNAYRELKDYKNAKLYCEKSLSEHQTSKTRELLDDVEKLIKEEEQKAYFDPVKAEEEKEIGNELFKKGDYETAVKHYDEAILRNPSDPKLYSNRAACYIKLATNDPGLRELAIDDCTSALTHNPNYLRPLIRRAKLYEETEKLDEALADYQKILELDPSYREAYIAVQKLPEQINQRNEKLKEEMMGKLKELGNMVLRPFGLSTNNFQLQQDPNSGSYSINFKK